MKKTKPTYLSRLLGRLFDIYTLEQQIQNLKNRREAIMPYNKTTRYQYNHVNGMRVLQQYH
jgi:hypothetical protein